MGTDLRWAGAGAGGGERGRLCRSGCAARCLSLSRDVILKSGSPFHQQQVSQSSGRMYSLNKLPIRGHETTLLTIMSFDNEYHH